MVKMAIYEYDVRGSWASTSSVNINVPCYDGSFPARNFFEDLEVYFEINEIPVRNQFKLSWARLIGKAKFWVKFNLQLGFNATYGQLIEVLELTFPDNIKWVLKIELYKKL